MDDKMEKEEEFQRHRNKRKPSLEDTSIPKKQLTKSPVKLSNKFEGLVEQNDPPPTPPIPPVALKRTDNYKVIIKRLNEVKKISCKVKPSGEMFYFYIRRSPSKTYGLPRRGETRILRSIHQS
ncbi:hypothetical protein AVEN_106040-1 [Araneus ventricosus]|uniref:Uncharacterized protein n=1 Tax=Araneus ventricosus TaxID=182803 RepID=A0A4Y2W3P7_ARAVE|nr:hypothetical protein AVEN_106040-1 [Araneus ventricosus]